jgi:hypothetical protein
MMWWKKGDGGFYDVEIENDILAYKDGQNV